MRTMPYMTLAKVRYGDDGKLFITGEFNNTPTKYCGNCNVYKLVE